jgi:hypothetical protein
MDKGWAFLVNSPVDRPPGCLRPAALRPANLDSDQWSPSPGEVFRLAYQERFPAHIRLRVSAGFAPAYPLTEHQTAPGYRAIALLATRRAFDLKAIMS